MTLRRALLAAAASLPAVAGALEPRFDHRDMHGPFVETLVMHDTTELSGGATASSWRPALRGGWGFDVTGEGGELLLGAEVTLHSFDDPQRKQVLLSGSARYRGYFGTEELKTFFEVGLGAPIRSRLAVGPMVGLGVAYDFSRAGGIFVAAELGSAFGQARIITFGALAGAQLRFELP